VDQPVTLVTPLVSTAFEENAYVVRRAGRTDCLVIDPGLDPDIILDYLDSHALAPAAILNTHGHGDHIAGNGVLKRRWPDCPLAIGVGDAVKLTDPERNLSAAFGIPLRSPPADITLSDGNTYSAAGIDLEILAIPGHSPGHVVYLAKDRKPYLAFVGDVIFAGSIGRTDFPDGNFDQLISGIRQKLFTLPDDTMLYPGHGPATTVGREKRTNPFVGMGV
jgi:glyoxylase-like metal-dependent hydrolase (beta-lactamase superfamily II)